MNLQWLIQSSHTQLVLSQVVYFNYRNEHIWSPTRKWLQILETFHLASIRIIIFYHFLNNTSHFRDRRLKFLIFQHREWAFSFLSTIYFNKKLFSIFPSQILVFAMVFAAHYLFSFWDLHLLSSLSKNNKRKWEDI